MSKIKLIQGSCVKQEVDVIVNSANRYLLKGAGICGEIFEKAGNQDLTDVCRKIETPLKDGDVVITPAFNIKNAKYIIHAVGPDFNITPNASKQLFATYYNSLKLLMDNNLHSISFPLISTGYFGKKSENNVAESTNQCINAYNEFLKTFPNYEINVSLCAYTQNEMIEARKIFDNNYNVEKTSDNYIKKYDSRLFNYYFIEDDNNIRIIATNEKELKHDKNSEYDDVEKAKLFFELTGDCDVTAFSAYMNAEFFFNNIDDDSVKKSFCFISEHLFNRAYCSKFDKSLIDKINMDLKKFYSSKELQLKYNFIILHPICFEITKDNEITYRPLISIDDTLINKIINCDSTYSHLSFYI